MHDKRLFGMTLVVVASGLVVSASINTNRPSIAKGEDTITRLTWVEKALRERCAVAGVQPLAAGTSDVSALKSNCWTLMPFYLDTSRAINGTFNSYLSDANSFIWSPDTVISNHAGWWIQTCPQSLPRLTTPTIHDQCNLPYEVEVETNISSEYDFIPAYRVGLYDRQYAPNGYPYIQTNILKSWFNWTPPLLLSGVTTQVIRWLYPPYVWENPIASGRDSDDYALEYFGNVVSAFVWTAVSGTWKTGVVTRSYRMEGHGIYGNIWYDHCWNGSTVEFNWYACQNIYDSSNCSPTWPDDYQSISSTNYGFSGQPPSLYAYELDWDYKKTSVNRSGERMCCSGEEGPYSYIYDEWVGLFREWRNSVTGILCVVNQTTSFTANASAYVKADFPSYQHLWGNCQTGYEYVVRHNAGRSWWIESAGVPVSPQSTCLIANVSYQLNREATDDGPFFECQQTEVVTDGLVTVESFTKRNSYVVALDNECVMRWTFSH